MENHLENIDAYFSETMSAEQKIEFERRVVEDKNFAEEVAFYLSALDVAKEEVAKEKKEWFRQLLKENPPATGKVRQLTPIRRIGIYRLAAAASVIGLLFLGWYLFLQEKTTAAQMADQYIETTYHDLPPTMGEVNSLDMAKETYNQGRFEEAAQKFEAIIKTDDSNDEAIKCAGISYLRFNNFEKALSYFRQLEKINLHSNPAVFLQAITLMKRNQPNDKQVAKQLLKTVIEKKLENSEVAEQWLKKL
jgi:tetratricopeptide (TPR) repeat protein